MDDQLYTQIRQLAAKRNTTITAVIEEALRRMLASQQVLRERPTVYLTTVDGKGLLPGVDLDDSAALLELMEDDGDTS
jgi:hypothetical protein